MWKRQRGGLRGQSWARRCGRWARCPRESRSRSCSSWRISRRERALDSNLADELARRQILALTDSALRNAGVTGIIPTPLDVVAKTAGITEIIDISRLPADIAARKPPALKRILGALMHRERVALVDLSQCVPRARLTEAHEIGHQIIPWHPGRVPARRRGAAARQDTRPVRARGIPGRRSPDLPGRALLA